MEGKTAQLDGSARAERFLSCVHVEKDDALVEGIVLFMRYVRGTETFCYACYGKGQVLEALGALWRCRVRSGLMGWHGFMVGEEMRPERMGSAAITGSVKEHSGTEQGGSSGSRRRSF